MPREAGRRRVAGRPEEMMRQRLDSTGKTSILAAFLTKLA